MQRDFKGIWIPKEIWLNEELDITEKAIFAEIDSLDNENGCTAGNNYFTKFFKVSESTITRAISHLKELGLIKSSFDGRVRTLRVVKMTTQSSQNDDAHIYNNTDNNIKDTLSNNTNNQQVLFIDKNINNKEVINKEDTYKEKAKKFVADYNEICVSLPKCKSLTDGRIKKIIKLLKKYSYNDILTVFKKLEESDFCTNRGGKGWKANIDFILSEDNFVKTLEGKYDNRNKRSGTGKSVEVTSLKEGEVARVVTQEEKEELRRMVERGELEEY